MQKTNIYNDIYNISLKSSNIVIFGSGSFGEIVSEFLIRMGYKIIAFCDNNTEKYGKKVNGIEVLSYNDIKRLYNKVFYLICSMWSLEIKEQLEKNNEEYYIVDMDNNSWIKEFVGWKNMAIDIVNACNLKCKSCARGRRIIKNSDDIMSFGLFKKIMYKAKNENFKIISLFNWSEPLLHPELDRFVEYAKDMGMEVGISTNLSLKGIDTLLKSFEKGLDSCYITVSGYSQKVHEINHNGSDINIVKNNLLKLSEFLKEKNINTHKVVVKFLVFSYNYKEKESFKKFCDDLGFSMQFIGASMFIGNCDIDENIEQNISNRQKSLELCNSILYGLPLDCRGDIYVCCFTANTSLSYVGNYLELSQEEIFFYRYFNPTCSVCKNKVPVCIPDELKDTLIYEPILKTLKQINQNT